MRQRDSRPLLVCVIAENQLAAEYLFQLLKDTSRFCPLNLERLPRNAGESDGLIFLFDNWGLTMPLSEWLRRLAARYPRAKHMVLDREQSDDNVVRMLSLGIHGFLPHREVAGMLTRALLAISQGQLWVTQAALATYVRFTASSTRKAVPGCAMTTPREQQIIELAKRRLSNKEIGAILKIHESTVRFHLSNVFAKLQISGRYELVGPSALPQEWLRMLA